MASKPKTQAPIDPGALGTKQAETNINTGITNTGLQNYNQVTDWGKTTYTYGGQDASGRPIFTQSTSLNPNELAYRDQLKSQGQDALDKGLTGLGSQPKVGRVESDPYSFMGSSASNLPAIAGNIPGVDWQSAYNDSSGFLRQTQKEQRDALDNKLKNQGLTEGSEAYDKAMRNQSVSDQFAQGQMAQSSYDLLNRTALAKQGQEYGQTAGLFGLGSQEANRLFGMDLSGAGLDAQRSLQLANLGRSVMPAPILQTQAPSYTGTSINPVNYTDLTKTAWDQNQQNINAGNQYRQGLWNTAGQVAGVVAAPFTGGLSLGLTGLGQQAGNWMSGGGTPQQLPWQQVGYNNQNWVPNGIWPA